MDIEYTIIKENLGKGNTEPLVNLLRGKGLFSSELTPELIELIADYLEGKLEKRKGRPPKPLSMVALELVIADTFFRIRKRCSYDTCMYLLISRYGKVNEGKKPGSKSIILTDGEKLSSRYPVCLSKKAIEAIIVKFKFLVLS